MKLNLHEECRTFTALAPAAMTTVAGRTGKIIDRRGYNGVEFVVAYGSITATDATITLLIKDGDVTGTMTSVADTYLNGTEVLAGVAAGARTSGTGKNVTKRLGYKGNKRYVQLSVSASTVTAATIIGATAVLFAPEAAATTNP